MIRANSVEQNTMIGTVINIPTITSSKCPLAAPTTPITLSILIIASATMIVQMAPIKEFLASICASCFKS